VHGAKGLGLCLDRLSLHLAQVNPHGSLDEFFSLNRAMSSNPAG
jgi:hypothetical protein